jgi:hypothetical protein
MTGSFSEEALALYSQLAAEKAGLNFAEGDSYDFTRCVRPDGSTYGTSGRCRKGTETAPKVQAAPAAPKSKPPVQQAKTPVRDDGQLKGAGAALRAAAERIGKDANRKEYAKAAADYRSRVADIKDEIRRNGSTPQLQAQLKMWQKKVADAESRAGGGVTQERSDKLKKEFDLATEKARLERQRQKAAGGLFKG